MAQEFAVYAGLGDACERLGAGGDSAEGVARRLAVVLEDCALDEEEPPFAVELVRAAGSAADGAERRGAGAPCELRVTPAGLFYLADEPVRRLDELEAVVMLGGVFQPGTGLEDIGGAAASSGGDGEAGAPFGVELRWRDGHVHTLRARVDDPADDADLSAADDADGAERAALAADQLQQLFEAHLVRFKHMRGALLLTLRRAGGALGQPDEPSARRALDAALDAIWAPLGDTAAAALAAATDDPTEQPLLAAAARTVHAASGEAAERMWLLGLGSVADWVPLLGLAHQHGAPLLCVLACVGGALAWSRAAGRPLGALLRCLRPEGEVGACGATLGGAAVHLACLLLDAAALVPPQPTASAAAGAVDRLCALAAGGGAPLAAAAEAPVGELAEAISARASRFGVDALAALALLCAPEDTLLRPPARARAGADADGARPAGSQLAGVFALGLELLLAFSTEGGAAENDASALGRALEATSAHLALALAPPASNVPSPAADGRREAAAPAASLSDALGQLEVVAAAAHRASAAGTSPIDAARDALGGRVPIRFACALEARKPRRARVSTGSEGGGARPSSPAPSPLHTPTLGRRSSLGGDSGVAVGPAGGGGGASPRAADSESRRRSGSLSSPPRVGADGEASGPSSAQRRSSLPLIRQRSASAVIGVAAGAAAAAEPAAPSARVGASSAPPAALGVSLSLDGGLARRSRPASPPSSQPVTPRSKGAGLPPGRDPALPSLSPPFHFGLLHSAAREAELREHARAFNEAGSGKRGVQALLKRGAIADESADAVATFLFEAGARLRQRDVADYLGSEQMREVLERYLEYLQVDGLRLDSAVRKLNSSIMLKVETQKLDRILKAFADRYHASHPGLFESADTPYVTTFALMMLNTDAHNDNIKHKMQLSAFARMLVEQKVPRELVDSYYHAIVGCDLQVEERAQITVVKEGWLLKQNRRRVGWKWRFCLLSSRALYVYKAQHDAEPSSFFPLEYTAIAQLGTSGPLSKKLEVRSLADASAGSITPRLARAVASRGPEAGRSMVLEARDERNALDWLRALQQFTLHEGMLVVPQDAFEEWESTHARERPRAPPPAAAAPTAAPTAAAGGADGGGASAAPPLAPPAELGADGAAAAAPTLRERRANAKAQQQWLGLGARAARLGASSAAPADGDATKARIERYYEGLEQSGGRPAAADADALGGSPGGGRPPLVLARSSSALSEARSDDGEGAAARQPREAPSTAAAAARAHFEAMAPAPVATPADLAPAVSPKRQPPSAAPRARAPEAGASAERGAATERAAAERVAHDLLRRLRVELEVVDSELDHAAADVARRERAAAADVAAESAALASAALLAASHLESKRRQMDELERALVLLDAAVTERTAELRAISAKIGAERSELSALRFLKLAAQATVVDADDIAADRPPAPAAVAARAPLAERVPAPRSPPRPSTLAARGAADKPPAATGGHAPPASQPHALDALPNGALARSAAELRAARAERDGQPQPAGARGASGASAPASPPADKSRRASRASSGGGGGGGEGAGVAAVAHVQLDAADAELLHKAGAAAGLPARLARLVCKGARFERIADTRADATAARAGGGSSAFFWVSPGLDLVHWTSEEPSALERESASRSSTPTALIRTVQRGGWQGAPGSAGSTADPYSAKNCAWQFATQADLVALLAQDNAQREDWVTALTLVSKAAARGMLPGGRSGAARAALTAARESEDDLLV